MFGGADSSNITEKIFDELICCHDSKDKFYELMIILGPGYQNSEAITKFDAYESVSVKKIPVTLWIH